MGWRERGSVSLSEVIMRPARQDDAEIGGRLMFLSGPELFSHTFSRPEEAVARLLSKMWTRKGHLFSYQWANLAEADSRVVGMLTGFAGGELRQASARMPLVFASVLWPWDLARMVARSADLAGLSPDVPDGDYYVGNVAVFPEARSQGVGHALMDFAEAQARARGSGRCALDVIIENDRAQALYRTCGYVILETHSNPRLLARCGISGMHRMVKYL
jgi:ribosomal protein S18 acetylase RimI-like enzyme